MLRVRLVVGLFDELANVRLSITRSAIAGVALELNVMTSDSPAPVVAAPDPIVPTGVQALPSAEY